ncbi:MAG TPA: MFS transporter [Terriglobia bacterium]|nr:MFS transporter [Terriglobia bacterium]
MHKTTDVRLLFTARFARLFAYGFLSVVLLLYLAELGLTENRIGLLLTLTLVGDTIISLGITTTADRIGRKGMLILGAALVVFAGVLFASTTNFVLLLIAATIGVISPSGNEVGPFLSIEQAALSQLISPERRTQLFAWYNLFGSFATALGALAGGVLAQSLQAAGMPSLDSYRVIVVAYASMGAVLLFMFLRLSPAAEAPRNKFSGDPPAGHGRRSIYDILGLPRSGRTVLKLSALFSLDAFAGGFILQSIVAYWFHIRYGVQPAVLGGIFFGGNILAGLSALSASWMARRIGLINTMVFTHIPSNILLILVPLMPNLSLAIVMLLLRFSISQMDVPTRQSYTMAVVDSGERSAAGGVTSVARSAGSSLAPVFAGRLLSASMLNAPFFLAGGLKILYDVLLYCSFRAAHAPEEN